MRHPSPVLASSFATLVCCSFFACSEPPAVPDATADVTAPDVTAPDVTPRDGDVTADDVRPDSTSSDRPAADLPATDASTDVAAADVAREDAAPEVGASDAADGGDGGGRTFADGGAPSSEFLALYDDIFGPRCGVCHGASAGTSTNLHMPDPVTAYVNLVNQPVRCLAPGGGRDGQPRVAPGDPDASVLPAPYEICQMRHTGTGQSFRFPDEVMRVRAWIANGAR